MPSRLPRPAPTLPSDGRPRGPADAAGAEQPARRVRDCRLSGHDAGRALHHPSAPHGPAPASVAWAPLRQPPHPLREGAADRRHPPAAAVPAALWVLRRGAGRPLRGPDRGRSGLLPAPLLWGCHAARGGLPANAAAAPAPPLPCPRPVPRPNHARHRDVPACSRRGGQVPRRSEPRIPPTRQGARGGAAGVRRVAEHGAAHVRVHRPAGAGHDLRRVGR
mmetsp:Transcript_145302/g.253579  ORF Transcript_145302/g.253579 Transcript_145302/m.253579 type:complete len:220 (-) Transcript_145302:167-826(-)